MVSVYFVIANTYTRIDVPDANTCSNFVLKINVSTNETIYNISVNYTLPGNTTFNNWWVTGNNTSVSFTDMSPLLQWNSSQLNPGSQQYPGGPNNYNTMTIHVNLTLWCDPPIPLWHAYNSSWVNATGNTFTNSSNIASNVFKPVLITTSRAIAVEGNPITPTNTPRAGKGEVVTWNITIKNLGIGDAKYIIFNVSNLQGFSNISPAPFLNSPCANCSTTDNYTYICNISVMAYENTCSIIYNTTVNSCDPSTLRTYINTTHGCGWNDCRLIPPLAQASTAIILESPMLNVTSSFAEPFGCGLGNVTYTIKNIGDAKAHNLSFDYVFFYNFIYANVVTSPDYDTISGNTLGSNKLQINWSDTFVLDINETINITIYFHTDCIEIQWPDEGIAGLIMNTICPCGHDFHFPNEIHTTARYPDVEVANGGPANIYPGGTFPFWITVWNEGDADTNTSGHEVEVTGLFFIYSSGENCSCPQMNNSNCANCSCIRFNSTRNDSLVKFLTNITTNCDVNGTLLRWKITNIKPGQYITIPVNITIPDYCGCGGYSGMVFTFNAGSGLQGCNYCNRNDTRGSGAGSAITCSDPVFYKRVPGMEQNISVYPRIQEPCHDIEIKKTIYNNASCANYTNVWFEQCFEPGFFEDTFHYHNHSLRIRCYNGSNWVDLNDTSPGVSMELYRRGGEDGLLCLRWNTLCVLLEMNNTGAPYFNRSARLDGRDQMNVSYNLTVNEPLDHNYVHIIPGGSCGNKTEWVIPGCNCSSTDPACNCNCSCGSIDACQNQSDGCCCDCSWGSYGPVMVFNPGIDHLMTSQLLIPSCGDVPIHINFTYPDGLRTAGVHDLMVWFNATNYVYVPNSTSVTINGRAQKGTIEGLNYSIDGGPYINTTQTKNSTSAEPHISVTNNGGNVTTYLVWNISDIFDGNDTFFYKGTLSFNVTALCGADNVLRYGFYGNNGCRRGSGGTCKLSHTDNSTDSPGNCNNIIAANGTRDVKQVYPNIMVKFDRKPEVMGGRKGQFKIYVVSQGPGDASNILFNITFDDAAALHYNKTFTPEPGLGIINVSQTNKSALFYIPHIDVGDSAWVLLDVFILNCNDDPQAMTIHAKAEVWCPCNESYQDGCTECNSSDPSCKNGVGKKMCTNASEDSSYEVMSEPDVAIEIYKPSTLAACEPYIYQNLSLRVIGLVDIYNVKVNYTPYSGMKVVNLTYANGTEIPYTENPTTHVINFSFDELKHKTEQNITITLKVIGYCAPICANLEPSQSHLVATYQSFCGIAQNRIFTSTRVGNFGDIFPAHIFVNKTPKFQYKDINETAEWNLTMTNVGMGLAQAINVSDILPYNLMFYNNITPPDPSRWVCPFVNGVRNTSVPVYTDCNKTGINVTECYNATHWWCYLGDTFNLSPGESKIIMVIGVNVSNCNGTFNNTFLATWGCPPPGCSLSECRFGPSYDKAEVSTKPTLFIDVHIEPPYIGICEEKNASIIIHNITKSANGYNLTANISLPDGVYFLNHTNWWVSGNNTPVIITVVNNSYISWFTRRIPPNNIINITFTFVGADPSGTCEMMDNLNGGNIFASLDYYSSCWNHLQSNDSTHIDYLLPFIDFSLSPDGPDCKNPIPVGGTMTWTLDVRNTGNGFAPNVTAYMFIPYLGWNLSASGVGNMICKYTDGSVISYPPDLSEINNGKIWWRGFGIDEAMDKNCQVQVNATVVGCAGEPMVVNIQGNCGNGPCNYYSGSGSFDFGCNASLAASKSADPIITEPGNYTLFEINITNPGCGDVSNVTLTDILPDGWRYINTTPNITYYRHDYMCVNSSTGIPLINKTICEGGVQNLQNCSTLGGVVVKPIYNKTWTESNTELIVNGSGCGAMSPTPIIPQNRHTNKKIKWNLTRLSDYAYCSVFPNGKIKHWRNVSDALLSGGDIVTLKFTAYTTTCSKTGEVTNIASPYGKVNGTPLYGTNGTANVTVYKPYLVITKTSNATWKDTNQRYQTERNTDLEITINVSEPIDSVATAYNVTITDMQPWGWNYLNMVSIILYNSSGSHPITMEPIITYSKGTTLNQTLFWALNATLHPGDYITLKYIVRVTREAFIDENINYAGVNFTDGDGGPGFNITSHSVWIEESPGLLLTKEADCCIEHGGISTFRLILTSLGDESFHHTTIYDILPPIYSYIPGSTVIDPEIPYTVDYGYKTGNIDAVWWNKSWHYRIPITITSGSENESDRTNTQAKITFGKGLERLFQEAGSLGDCGRPRHLDENSIRVTYFNNETNEVIVLPRQKFVPNSGKVIFNLDNDSDANNNFIIPENKSITYYVYFDSRENGIKDKETFADILPTSLIYTASKGYTQTSNDVAWHMSFLFRNSSITITFKAIANNTDMCNLSCVINKAVVVTETAYLVNIGDLRGREFVNEDYAMLMIVHPQLDLVKWANVSAADVGDTVRYTIALRNPTTIDIDNACVKDDMQAGFLYNYDSNVLTRTQKKKVYVNVTNTGNKELWDYIIDLNLSEILPSNTINNNCSDMAIYGACCPEDCGNADRDCCSLLPFCIHNCTTGSVSVRIPHISPYGTEKIIIYYGDLNIINSTQDCEATYAPSNHTDTSNILGIWHMDDMVDECPSCNKKVSDDSGNAVDGNYYGSSLYFDGSNDIVNAGNASNLNMGAGFTLEAWANGFGEMTLVECYYRRTISINNTNNSDELNNYQIKLIIDNSYFNGNLNDNYSDLRFMDAYGNLLYYWIENYTGNVSSGTGSLSVWINVTKINANALTNIYMFYKCPYNDNSEYNNFSRVFTKDSDVYSKFELNNLAGLWHFDEGTGNMVYDISWNSNNGLYNRGTSILVNGSQYIRVPSSDSLNFNTNSFTIETWLKGGSINILNGEEVFPNIIYKDVSYSLFVNETHIGGYINHKLFACVKPDLSNWTHIVEVYNGTHAMIYANGNMVCSVPLSAGVISSNPVDLIIGKHWNGLMDDVRIYSRSLSQEEILQHYNSSYINESGLVASYHFEDVGYQTAVDTSLYGNDGIDGSTIYEDVNDPVLSFDTPWVPWGANDSGRWGDRIYINYSYKNFFNGSYLNFDGVDTYVEIPDSKSLSPTTRVSVKAWVKGSGSSTLDESSWCNTTCQYRQKIEIDNTGRPAHYNYQIPVDIDYTPGRMKQDFSDIRIFYSSTSTECQILNYWIEEKNKNACGGDLDVTFVSPTPADNKYICKNSVIINSSIKTKHADLNTFIFNWNGTNYTFAPQELLHFYSNNSINDTINTSINGQTGIMRTYADNGLVLAMSFENRSYLGENYSSPSTNNTVYDYSKYGNNGTTSGGLIYNATGGKYGGAFMFDGVNDYIQVDNVPVNITPGPKKNTVEFWMYWTGGDSQMPFGWNCAYDLWLYNNSFGFNTGNSNIEGISGTSFLQNSWHHIVAIFPNGVPNNENAELWIDGERKTITHQFGGGPSSRTATSRIFVSGWGPNVYHKFGGRIDELRIYNRALSAEEIRMRYLSNLQKFNETLWYFYSNITNLTSQLYKYSSYANNTNGCSDTETRRLPNCVMPEEEQSNHTRLWVKVPDIPANSKISLYMYSGNCSGNLTNTTFDNVFTKNYNDPFNLQGEWNFDEGSGIMTQDSSSQNNDGRINNATWNGCDGGYGVGRSDVGFETGDSLYFCGQQNWISHGGWLYRTGFTINNPNNLINHPVPITFNTQTLVAQGKMNPNCSDIRATDSDGVTLLPYAVENCNTTNTTITVKVPQIQGGINKEIYIYYGYPGSGDASNPGKVFAGYISVADLSDYDIIDYPNAISSPSKWKVNTTGNYIYDTSNIHMTNHFGTMLLVPTYITDNLVDFEVKVTVRANSRSNEHDYTGLVFNYQDIHNWYSYQYTHDNCTGGIGIMSINKNRTSSAFNNCSINGSIANYSPAPNVQDLAELMVRRYGNNIEAYLNGTLVMSVVDGSYHGGRIGFMLNAQNGGEFHFPFIVRSYAPLLTVTQNNEEKACNAYVDVGNHSSLNFGGNKISLEAWVLANGNSAEFGKWPSVCNGFQYLQKIMINNSANKHQLMHSFPITIDTQYLIARGFLKNDCSDLRFVDPNGNRINYYIESGCNTVNMTIWLDSSIISVFGNTGFNISMCYHNPGADSHSNDSMYPNYFIGTEFYTTCMENGGTFYISSYGNNNNISIYNSTGNLVASRVINKDQNFTYYCNRNNSYYIKTTQPASVILSTIQPEHGSDDDITSIYTNNGWIWVPGHSSWNTGMWFCSYDDNNSVIITNSTDGIIYNGNLSSGSCASRSTITSGYYHIQATYPITTEFGLYHNDKIWVVHGRTYQNKSQRYIFNGEPTFGTNNDTNPSTIVVQALHPNTNIKGTFSCTLTNVGNICTYTTTADNEIINIFADKPVIVYGSLSYVWGAENIPTPYGTSYGSASTKFILTGTGTSITTLPTRFVRIIGTKNGTIFNITSNCSSPNANNVNINRTQQIQYVIRGEYCNINITSTYPVVVFEASNHQGEDITTILPYSHQNYPDYEVSSPKRTASNIITKSNAYGLYANQTHICGMLNNSEICINGDGCDWQHVAMTYDGSTIKMYRNGELVSTLSLTTNIPLAGVKTLLGSGFGGSIDAVRIYKRALSDCKIKAHYERRGDTYSDGDCITPITMKQREGITIGKMGGYGLAFSEDKVFAMLNNYTISAYYNTTDWSYIAMTYDGQNLSLYVNGTLRNSMPLSVPINDFNNNFKIGDFFNGGIDEVRVYSRSLLPHEIKTQYERRYYTEPEPTYFFSEQELTFGATIFKGTSYGLNFGAENITGFIDNGTNITYLYGNGSKCNNCWRHAALVYDRTSNTLNLYINGLLAASTSTAGSIRPSTDNLLFGKFFKGYLDEIRLYPTPLTSSQISDNYNGILTPGATSVWSFNERIGQVARDRGTGSNDAMLGSTPGIDEKDPVWRNNAPVYWVSEGVLSSPSALRFNDYDNYVEVIHDQSLALTQEGTLEVWIIPSETNRNQVLVSKGLDNAENYEIMLTNNGKIRINANSDVGIITHDFNPVLNPGGQYFIAVTYQSGTFRLYINGNLADTFATTSTTLVPSSQNLYFGADKDFAGNLNRYYSGVMDEVRIYNKKLESNQIACHYQGTECPADYPQPSVNYSSEMNGTPDGTIYFNIAIPKHTTRIITYTANITPNSVNTTGRKANVANVTGCYGPCCIQWAADSWGVFIPRKPHLMVAKEVDKETVQYGDIVNYTITIANTGNDNLFNVTLHDILPYGFKFLNISPISSWICTNITPGVNCTNVTEPNENCTCSGERYSNTSKEVWLNISMLPGRTFNESNHSKYITITALVTEDAVIGENTNKVTVTGKVYDGSTLKSMDIAITVVNESMAFIEKKSLNTTLMPGQNASYEISITNQGRTTLYNVTIRDKMPDGFTIITNGTMYHNFGNITYSNGNFLIGNLGKTEGYYREEVIIAFNATGDVTSLVNASDNLTLNLNSSNPNPWMNATFNITNTHLCAINKVELCILGTNGGLRYNYWNYSTSAWEDMGLSHNFSLTEFETYCIDVTNFGKKGNFRFRLLNTNGTFKMDHIYLNVTRGKCKFIYLASTNELLCDGLYTNYATISYKDRLNRTITENTASSNIELKAKVSLDVKKKVFNYNSNQYYENEKFAAPDTVTFRINITNTGYNSLKDILLIDHYPKGLNFTSANYNVINNEIDRTITLNFSELSNKLNGTTNTSTPTEIFVELNFTVLPNMTTGRHINFVEFKGKRCAKHYEDHAIAEFTIVKCYIIVDKDVDKQSVQIGDTATYLVKIYNPTEAVCYNISIYEEPQQGFATGNGTLYSDGLDYMSNNNGETIIPTQTTFYNKKTMLFSTNKDMPPYSTFYLVFNATANNDAVSGKDTAYVVAHAKDNITKVALSFDSANLDIAVAVSPVLSLIKDALNLTINPGDKVTYKLGIRMMNPGTIYNITLNDKLPEHWTYVDGSVSEVVCSQSCNAFYNGSLTPNATATAKGVNFNLDNMSCTKTNLESICSFTFNAIVPINTTQGLYKNTVQGNWTDFNGTNHLLHNTSSVVFVKVTEVYPLLVVKEADKDVVQFGEQLTYKIRIQNPMTVPLNVTLKDTLPKGLQYISVSISNNANITPFTCTKHYPIKCEVNLNILPAGSVFVNITTNVTSDVTDQEITNTVKVNGTTPSNTPISGESTTTTFIENPGIRIVKWTDEYAITPITYIPFHILIQNPSETTLKDIYLLDTLPVGYKYIQNSTKIDGVSLINTTSRIYVTPYDGINPQQIYLNISEIPSKHTMHIEYSVITDCNISEGSVFNNVSVNASYAINSTHVSQNRIYANASAQLYGRKTHLVISKIANKHKVSWYDVVTFKVTMFNPVNDSANAILVNLTDTMSPGLAYIRNSATLNGELVEPLVLGNYTTGETLVWRGAPINQTALYIGERTVLEYKVLVMPTSNLNLMNNKINVVFLDPQLGGGYQTENVNDYDVMMPPLPSMGDNLSTNVSENVQVILGAIANRKCAEVSKIQLKKGWNLISLPTQPVNNDITELLLPIEGHYTDVFTYSNGWSYKSKYMNKWFGSLNKMNVGMGYWIKVDKDVNLTYIGREVIDWNMTLNKGWNLVGLPQCDDYDIVSIDAQYTDLFAYHPDEKWSYRSKYMNKWFGDLKNMQPARGYWIKVEDEGIIIRKI